MKNILTILRRDLAAYYTSPIGYIFMIVFLLVSVGLYITSFFTFPMADMRNFFSNLPILLCVFIPAVTMRVWAEERKENTWEMLLTFPMKARELVLGKFLACLVFYILTLASTITVPIMLKVLGRPDTGAMFGGYLGAFLMGAFFLSIGIFFSAFCRDQIVAFVVTLLACFALFLLGTNFIASAVDGAIPGLGSNLSRLLGVISHFDAFTRGVVELADLVYFIAWTVIFLALNIMFIEGRSRKGAKVAYATALALCFAIGMAFNWLASGQSFGRFDLTQDKIYTISDASKDILSKLDTPVQVKIYITPKDKMPTGMTQLEQDISDKLDDLKIASGGKLAFTPVHLEAANIMAEQEKMMKDKDADKDDEKDENKSIEKRMLEKGIEPFSVRAMSEDQVTNKLVYSSIGVAYKDKKEEIIPQVMPETIQELEYRLISTIYKLTRTKAPVVALVAPKEAVTIDPQMRAIYQQLGQPIPESDDPYEYLEKVLRYEKYDVQRVELTKDSPLPDNYDTLVVANPRSLNDRQRWEINRALVAGKKVVIAVQNYEWDYQMSRDGLRVNKRDENPKVNELLEFYGLGVDRDILMDSNQVPLTVQTNSLAAMLGGGTTVRFAMQMLISGDSMDPDVSITSRLSSVFYLWGSALTLDQDKLKQNGLEAKVIMNSGKSAWKVAKDAPLSRSVLEQPGPDAELKQYPLMAMVTGQFPDAFKDKPRPVWPEPEQRPGQPPRPSPPEDATVKPVTPAPGKLILLGCSEMFRKNFLQGGGGGNLDLFLNSVDAVTLGDDLIKVRGKKPIDRTIERPSDAKRNTWKAVNYAGMSSLIAAIGIVSAVTRRRSRNAYTVSFNGAEE
ncbi:MAG: Gldg family protein [Candidatus Hydrogenedentes bacterium]|nr:Gldg family protein [Candidatus Hydrogenedentota bacterium]